MKKSKGLSERDVLELLKLVLPKHTSDIDLASKIINAMQQELQRRLHVAIGELDEDDREIVLMRHFEQLSNQEVAALLGLTEAAASMRHLRALRKLRELLQPE